MQLNANIGARILAIIQILVFVAFATPNLGIRADFLNPSGNPDSLPDKYIQSYSSIIKFNDASIPLDKTKMTDAKLLHMAVIAYKEMITVWRSRNIPSIFLPGAMAVIASGDRLYFASALRARAGSVELAEIPHGSIRAYMDEALTMSIGTHTRGGGCSEISCLELFWDKNGQKDPPKGPTKSRIAIWVLPRNKQIDTNSEVNAAPCTVQANSDAGYGCHEIVFYVYDMEAIDSTVAPDAAGEDDWAFTLEKNPRPPCK